MSCATICFVDFVSIARSSVQESRFTICSVVSSNSRIFQRIVFPLCLAGCSSKLAFSNTFDIRLFNSLITGSVSVSQFVFASLALAMDLAKDITSSIKSIVESFRSEQLFVRRFTARSIMPCGFLGRMLIALGACCNCKRIEFSSRSHVAMLHRFRLVFILFRVRLFHVEH